MSLFTYLLGWNKNPKHIYAVFFFNAYGNWFVLCHVKFVWVFCNHCLVNFLTIKGLTSACKCFGQRVTLMLKNLWCDQCFLSSQVLSVLSTTHLSIDILITDIIVIFPALYPKSTAWYWSEFQSQITFEH